MLKKIVPKDNYELAKVQDNVAEAVNSINGMPWNGGVILEDVVFGGSSQNTMVSTVSTNTNVGASATPFNATSLSLSPGRWRIQGWIRYQRNGATVTSDDLLCGVNTSSATLGSEAINFTNSNLLLTTYNKQVLFSPIIDANLTVTTTYYLIGYHGSYSGGPPQYMCELFAEPLAQTSAQTSDKVVQHGLRRTPSGFTVLKKSAPGDIYLSSSTNHRPDLEIILKSTNAMTATLWIF